VQMSIRKILIGSALAFILVWMGEIYLLPRYTGIFGTTFDFPILGASMYLASEVIGLIDICDGLLRKALHI